MQKRRPYPSVPDRPLPELLAAHACQTQVADMTDINLDLSPDCPSNSLLYRRLRLGYQTLVSALPGSNHLASLIDLLFIVMS